MAAHNHIETERKFLLANDDWRSGVVDKIEMRAGYLNNDPQNSISIRFNGNAAFINLQGAHGSFDIMANPEMAVRIRNLLQEQPNAAVRVRTENDTAYLIVKGKEIDGDPLSRPELDVVVNLNLANEILSALCVPEQVVSKTRHLVPVGDMTWEVDVFHGRNAGLVVAEIEIPSKDTTIVPPSWVGAEVSLDKRYSNLALSLRPFTKWDQGAENFNSGSALYKTARALKNAI